MTASRRNMGHDDSFSRSSQPLTGVPPELGSMLTGFGFSAATAASAAWKPTLECVPSQNGLLVLAPQRQSENAGLLLTSTGLPSTSMISTSPGCASTR